MIKILTLPQFHRLQSRTRDYEEALTRTNLAIRCWEKQRTENGGSPAPQHRILTWLLANHIIQAFYRRNGIDVIPFSIGGMYGYGMSVGPQKPNCTRTDLHETAWIACGSVRVDPKTEGLASYEVTREISQGQDPLWIIDRAARLAVGEKWPDKCPHPTCPHISDGETYRTVYQIITLLLTMGYLRDAILGTHVACGEYGEQPEKLPRHPLYIHGMIKEPCFTQDWFELSSAVDEIEPWGWIHRHTGDLVTFGGELVSFQSWCKGGVDRGLEWIAGHR